MDCKHFSQDSWKDIPANEVSLENGFFMLRQSSLSVAILSIPHAVARACLRGVCVGVSMKLEAASPFVLGGKVSLKVRFESEHSISDFLGHATKVFSIKTFGECEHE